MKISCVASERRSPTQLAYGGATALLLLACETLTGYEPFYPPPPDAGTDRAVTPPCGAPPPADLAGPKLIAHEVNGRCFWIDETEVTRADYARFLDDEDATAPVEEAPCHENATLEPASVGSDGGESCSAPGVVSSAGDHPIVCVDWCDARAYCRWAGKSLCRDQYISADSLENDWYAACANGTRRNIYPYGTQHYEDLCNGAERPGSGCTAACTTVAAGSLSSCNSVLGVKDLSGNVSEWTEACRDSSGLADLCRTRGGSFQSDSQGLACLSSQSFARGTRYAAVGFRCCWYPK